MRQVITATTVPRGYAGRLYRASVVFSPRIYLDGAPEQTLASFRDVLVWPTLSRTLTYTFVLSSSTNRNVVVRVPITDFEVPPVPKPHLDFDGSPQLITTFPEFWSSLFPNDTPVDSADDYATLETKAAPATIGAAGARSAVDDIIVNHIKTKVPGVTPPNTDGLRYIRFERNDAGRNRSRLHAYAGSASLDTLRGIRSFVSRTSPPPPSGSRQGLFAFNADGSGVSAVTDVGDRLKLHQIFASVMHYPIVLRYGGLVVDFTVSRSVVDAAIASAATDRSSLDRIRVEVTWTPAADDQYAARGIGRVIVSPSTRIVHDDAAFFAARAETDPIVVDANGMVVMDESYFVDQLDFIKEGAKMAPADDATTTSGSPSPGASESAQLDPHGFRSGALTLYKDDHHLNVRQHVASAQKLLDDLESLAQPSGSVAITSIAPAASHDITSMQLRVGYRIDVRDLDAPNSAWRSLCQRTVVYDARLDGTPNDYAVADDEGWTRPTVLVDFAPPNNPPTIDQSGQQGRPVVVPPMIASWSGWSLIAPRPVRGLDSLTRDAARARKATESRFKCSAQPTPRSLPTLRFGHRYEFRVRTVSVTGDGPGLDAPTLQGSKTEPVRYVRFERVLAPVALPRKGSAPGPGGSDTTVVVRNLRRDPSSARGVAPAIRYVTRPACAIELAERHGLLDSSSGSPRSDLYDAIAARDNEIQTEYDPRSQLMYIPDPFAKGVALIDPSGAQPAQRTPFLSRDQQWRSFAPQRLVVTPVDDGTPFTFARTTDGFEIKLPPAYDTALALQSTVADADVDSLGLWQRFSSHGALTAADFRAAIENGAIDFVTPAAALRLVHAVRVPLTSPGITLPSGTSTLETRNRNDTEVRFRGTIAAVPVTSASKLELLAEWREWAGDGSRKKPLRFERVVYTREIKGDARGHVASGDTPTVPDTSIAMAGVRQEFNDHKARRVTYRLRYTSRFREFFPDNTGLTSASIPWDEMVTATAPPAVPAILFAIPLFGNSDPQISARLPRTARFTRRGGAFRLFLSSDWFSSGEGEQLGIIVADTPPEDAANDPLAEYASNIGADPTLAQQSTPAIQEVAFPWGRLATAADGTPRFPVYATRLPESPQDTSPAKRAFLGNVRVYAHDVGFDDERKLWFADICIRNADLSEISSYMPIVQVGAVRYQPSAIAGCEISETVTSQLVMLAPDRFVTVQFTSGDEVHRCIFSVTSSSSPFADSAPGRPSNTFTAELDVLVDDGMEDSPGRWKHATWIPYLAGLTPAVGRFHGKAVVPLTDSLARYRISIREYEWFAIDPSLSANERAPFQKDPPGHKECNPTLEARGAMMKRVCFAKSIALGDLLARL